MRDMNKCYMRKIDVKQDGTLRDDSTSKDIYCPITKLHCTIDCAFYYEEQQIDRTIVGCCLGNTIIGLLV